MIVSGTATSQAVVVTDAADKILALTISLRRNRHSGNICVAVLDLSLDIKKIRFYLENPSDIISIKKRIISVINDRNYRAHKPGGNDINSLKKQPTKRKKICHSISLK